VVRGGGVKGNPGYVPIRDMRNCPMAALEPAQAQLGWGRFVVVVRGKGVGGGGERLG
jgi:hypothetical protein